MDLNTLVTIGERVDIDVDGASLKSIIQDIETRDTLLVTQLTRKSIPVYIEPGRVLTIMFKRANGMFIFDAMLEGYTEVSGQRYMRLRPVSEARRQQRRNSYRLAISVPGTVKILSAAPTGQNQRMEFTTNLFDLSEGGIGMNAPQSYSISTMFDLSVVLGEEYEQYTFRCVVMRCIWPNVKDEPYRIGAQFVDMSDAQRRKISRFILAEQVRQRYITI